MHTLRSALRLSALIAGFTVLANAANAGDYSNSGSYNSGYGMNAGQENAAANPNLRDGSGNLTNVNGQFTSGSFSSASSSSSASGAGYASSSVSGGGGVGGNGGSSNGTTMYGTATAMGNSLNVVTVGSYNTVIVNSNQTNTGDVTANVNLNGN